MNTAEKRVVTSLPGASEKIIKTIQKRRSRELVIGLCGAIGSGVKALKNTIVQSLEESGYTVVHIRLSDIIAKRKNISLSTLNGFNRYNVLQDRGDELRKEFDNDILAACAIDEIAVQRGELFGEEEESDETFKTDAKVAYILDQLKHPDEVSLLRTVYPHNFYLLGLIRTERERRLNLEEEKITSDEIDKLIRRDRKSTPHGQQVEKTFYSADFFIRNQQNQSQLLKISVDRFIKLIHGANGITPSREEIGMFSAYSSSLRSACLSRQVGAAIMNESGKIIATGCNDVPEFNGGLYSADSEHDFRCVHRGHCSNDRHKDILKQEIKDILLKSTLAATDLESIVEKITADTKIKSLIEYSRAIHAEMDAIVSLSRQTSESTMGTTLYATTYPCHNCARHIVAAGIRKVIYIEPYEKSLALKLHDDSISETEELNKVQFLPFEGVSPNRFEKFFKANGNRKDNDGRVIQVNTINAYHVDSQYLDSYHDYEAKISEKIDEIFGEAPPDTVA
ncbi:anti-phage dCTP deaminase [Aeromonas caviae]|uniref:anti-phage dCTP deaminase n=1 Tax=Aeromonas caviae TaxID=648 RepID=UPI0038D20091